MGFEVLDISGDVGIRAFGASREEALVSAGVGMYSLITDVDRVREKDAREIEVGADSLEGLLVSYLNELIFHFDTYGFIGKKIEVSFVGALSVKATISGEEFDLDRHEQRLLIKAATYHNVRFARMGDWWQAEVMFDI